MLWCSGLSSSNYVSARVINSSVHLASFSHHTLSSRTLCSKNLEDDFASVFLILFLLSLLSPVWVNLGWSRSRRCSAQAYVTAGDPSRNPWTQGCWDARAPASQPSCLPPPVASSSAVMGRSSGQPALSIVGKVVTVLRRQRCKPWGWARQTVRLVL